MTPLAAIFALNRLRGLVCYAESPEALLGVLRHGAGDIALLRRHRPKALAALRRDVEARIDKLCSFGRVSS